jgi:hypothetical protein
MVYTIHYLFPNTDTNIDFFISGLGTFISEALLMPWNYYRRLRLANAVSYDITIKQSMLNSSRMIEGLGCQNPYGINEARIHWMVAPYTVCLLEYLYCQCLRQILSSSYWFHSVCLFLVFKSVAIGDWIVLMINSSGQRVFLQEKEFWCLCSIDSNIYCL